MISVLQGIITAFAGVRVAMIIFSAITEPDENRQTFKRIKNVLVFWIAAMGATVITRIIQNYF